MSIPTVRRLLLDSREVEPATLSDQRVAGCCCWRRRRWLVQQPVIVGSDDGVLLTPGRVGRSVRRQRRLSHFPATRPPGRPSLETTSFLGCGSRLSRRCLFRRRVAGLVTFHAVNRLPIVPTTGGSPFRFLRESREQGRIVQ